MRKSCLTQQLAFAVLAIALAIMSSDNCIASGGSWGGSLGGGSLGSRGFAGGSWGARGGFRTPVRNFFAYRQPVRNLFRGIAGGFRSLGSRGYGSGGYASAGYGSAGIGGYGSGRGYGSGGSNYGSAGGYGSSGYSYYASSGYAPATSFVSAPSTNYAQGISYGGSYSSPSIISSSISNCSDCIGSATGVPIDSNAISPATIPYNESNVYGGSSVLDSRNPILNSTDPYYGEGSIVPSEGSGSSVDESGVRGFETPPTPEPASGNDETTFLRRGDAILNVNVPLDARVYVNDRLTTTSGTSRSYVSRKLTSEKDYTFNVEAIVERDGKNVSLKRQIAVRAGRSHFVNFDFVNPVETQLTVKVPENASIKLCGNNTSAKGTVRNFKTKLMPGKIWQDYNIEVSFDKDGKPVTQQRTLTIEAGGKYVIDFETEKDQFVSR